MSYINRVSMIEQIQEEWNWMSATIDADSWKHSSSMLGAQLIVEEVSGGCAFDARMSEIHDGSSAKAHSVLKRLPCEDLSSWFSCLFRVRCGSASMLKQFLT